MNYLIVTGAPQTGKSETIFGIGKLLLSEYGFKDISHAFEIPIAKQLRNCLCILEGKNRKGVTKRILINTPAHDLYHINQLHEFYMKNKDIDIIFTSTRDGADKIYHTFFEIMNIDKKNDHVYEVPLGKITRRNNSDEALIWYKDACRNLIIELLKKSDFEL